MADDVVLYLLAELEPVLHECPCCERLPQRLEQEGEVFSQAVDYGHSEDDKAEKPKLGGAERGTAYHRIMELLDDSIYGDATLFEKEKADIAKVVEKWLLEKQESGILPSSYAEVMKPYDVATFLLTDLGKRMGQAFRNGSLMREKPFMMGLPASELDEKFPSDEMVLIQGIIDAFFIEDGEIVLLDYKTDRVRSAEELVTRYKIQLDYYKRAIEASTATKVKEVYIYSFALGKVIKL